MAVTYGNHIFVAVGDGGTIVTSPDGVNWSRRDSGINTILDAVAYGNGTYVAIGFGDRDQIAISKDGISWTVHSIGYNLGCNTGQIGLAWGGHLRGGGLRGLHPHLA